MRQWETVYEKWMNCEGLDSHLKQELEAISNQPEVLEDAFYRDLAFGTGGMRGVLGPGTNRLNRYTVRKAVNGLCHYLKKHCVNVYDRGVAVSYDSRYMSKAFALETAKVLGAHGIKAYVFNTLHPTPLLSFAVRYLGAAAGVMITASHNPPEYNGFKVYNEDGGQITPNEAAAITEEIEKTEDELSVPVIEQAELEAHDLLTWGGQEVDNAYLEQLKSITKLDSIEQQQEKDLQIVFTPLHGTAHNLVVQALKQLNFYQVDVVEEQATPDPEFSTVASPNPEEHQAFTMAIDLAKRSNADILIGTDPDADRLGAAVTNDMGEYTVLTGNQLGALMLDYRLKTTNPKLLANARMIKTIVTSELGRRIADNYGVKTIDTLTGFKYIGEKIRQFDATGESFTFGYEESYGYLISDVVRDKDAVQAAVFACEMAYYWKKQGKTLYDALHSLYEQYGYYLEDMISLKLTGKEGTDKISSIMQVARTESLTDIGGVNVQAVEDYWSGKRITPHTGQTEQIELPRENVVKFLLDDDCWVCLRPSGTEPKLKCYVGVRGDSEKESKKRLDDLTAAMNDFLMRCNRN
ncbi:phospho-sugar mutase [Lentibacillus cibarius]|uniref:phosphoglucomutase (alpha-D-glucose-1,6-bisphosphate-dependent) n=1 Tax=Lentibacillus cibarius TaxID=2583219 RepID=A0A549YG25_9BACI|nr:phospho-sugar mutase [Lentibacillus cibarius]TRM10834.1 phospho-sugar mutase [Lentibacillus cibarius]